MSRSISTSDALSSLLSELGTSAHKRDLVRLGAQLGAIAGRAPYSYKYVHSVLNGSLEAGQKFHRAVLYYLATFDGMPIGRMGLEQVVVFGRPEYRSAQVEGDVRYCANPDCGIKFVTDLHNRKYCKICHPPKRK